MGFDDETTTGALFPEDGHVHNNVYTLNEIKRLLIWANHTTLRTREEQGFVAFTQSDVSSGGGTINLHLKNPSSNSVSLDVQKFSVSTQFRGQYSIFDSFSTSPSGGTADGIDNLLMDSDNETNQGNAEVNSNVDFTADGTHFQEAIPSGGQGASTSGGVGTGTEPIIEPGREIVIQLQNDSTNTRPGSVGVVYSEDPTTYS